MGQVLIEIPQNIRRTFRVKSSKCGEQLLKELEENSDSAASPAVIPPRRNSITEDSDEVLGIWSNSVDVTNEIARKVRENNRKTT